MSFPAAIVAAQAVSLGVGVVLSRRFVFAPSGRSVWQDLPAVIAVDMTSLLGVTPALDRALRATGLDGTVAEAAAHPAGIAAGAVVNVLGHRAFTFANRRRHGVATVPRRA